MIVKHPRMIIKQHEYFTHYRYVGDVSVFTLIQWYSHDIVEWGFLRIIKVVHNIFHIMSIGVLGGSPSP